MNLYGFIEWLESRNFSPFTVDAYKYDLRLFGQYLDAKGKTAEEVTEADFSEFISKYTRSHKAASIKRMFASIPKFYKYLEVHGRIKAYPFTALDFDRPKIKNTRARERTYTDDEMARIAQVVKQQKDPLAGMIIEVLRSSSLRARELLALNYKFLDLEKMQGTVIRKGGNRWPIKFSVQSAKMLKEHYAVHKDAIEKRGGKVFGISYHKEWRLLRHIGREAGLLVPLRPHKLRHYWTTLMLEDNVNRSAIVKLGGWNSDAMLNTYGHETDKHLTEEFNKSRANKASPITELARLDPGLAQDAVNEGVEKTMKEIGWGRPVRKQKRKQKRKAKGQV